MQWEMMPGNKTWLMREGALSCLCSVYGQIPAARDHKVAKAGKIKAERHITDHDGESRLFVFFRACLW